MYYYSQLAQHLNKDNKKRVEFKEHPSASSQMINEKKGYEIILSIEAKGILLFKPPVKYNLQHIKILCGLYPKIFFSL